MSRKRSRVVAGPDRPLVYGAERAGSDEDRFARWNVDHEGSIAGMPPTNRTRIIQIKCDRCPQNVAAIVFECRHADGYAHDVAEVQRMIDRETAWRVPIQLDAEPVDAEVLIDCTIRTHGSAVASVGELIMMAATGHRRRPAEGARHAAKSAVYRLSFA